ncbi:MAG: O-methyltransferase [Clostridium sp.]
MSGITYDYMEEYLRGLIGETNNALKELEEYAEKNRVPIAQKETANFLEFMINLKKPKKILELGTAIGYSAILMAMTSSSIEKIVTVERDENMVNIARDNIKRFNLEDKIEVVQGDCLELLEGLSNKYEGQFDIIFMDAGKGHYNHFLPYCLKLMAKEGIIIADNVLFRGMVASKELAVRRKITIIKRMRKYLELVSDKEKFITSVIPMGDGIAVTMRRD